MLREIRALGRASWQMAASYRLGMVLSVVSLAAVVVPLYFIANALQPTMASRIVGEGPQYFGFVLFGAVTFSLVSATTSALPNAVGASIGQGTLEAILATPARTSGVMAGLAAYSVSWAAVRAVIVAAGGILLGARVEWGGLPITLLILALVLAAYAAIGMVATALILRFRTSGPLVRGILTASMFLGGVYYPTHVIPTWVQGVADVIPLTYGLRAIRGVLLAGADWRAIARDFAILAAFTAVLIAIGLATLASALRHARREGTLAQY